MRQPPLFLRLCGFWPVTLLLIAGGLLAVHAWYVGRLAFLPAWTAAGLALGAVRSFYVVREHRIEEAHWRAMGGEPPARKRNVAKPLFYGALAVIFIGVPVLVGTSTVRNIQHVNGLIIIWLLVLLGIAAVAGVRFGKSYLSGRADRRAAKALAAPTAWMLSRARSSPSRAAAARQVPDYARKLMRRQ